MNENSVCHEIKLNAWLVINTCKCQCHITIYACKIVKIVTLFNEWIVRKQMNVRFLSIGFYFLPFETSLGYHMIMIVTLLIVWISIYFLIFDLDWKRSDWQCFDKLFYFSLRLI